MHFHIYHSSAFRKIVNFILLISCKIVIFISILCFLLLPALFLDLFLLFCLLNVLPIVYNGNKYWGMEKIA